MTTLRDRSILPREASGLIRVSGPRGSGKSTFAATADWPGLIAFFDFESKGKGIEQAIERGGKSFGLYRAINEECEGKPASAVFTLADQIVESFEQDAYTVLVLDNSAILQQGMTSWIIEHAAWAAKQYGYDAGKIVKNQFGQRGAAVNGLIGTFCAKAHSKGVRAVIVITHRKAQWSGGVQLPGKWRLPGADRFDELSILSIMLAPPRESEGTWPPPAALVLKQQFGTIEIDVDPLTMTDDEYTAFMNGETGHKLAPKLPPRLYPATWQRIRAYLTNPPNYDELTESEQATAQEIGPYSSTMDKQQIAFVTLALQAQLEESRSPGGSGVSAGSVGGMMAAAQQVPALPPQVVECVDKIRVLLSENDGMTVAEAGDKLKADKIAPLPFILRAVSIVREQEQGDDGGES